MEKARKAKRAGKTAATRAGALVRAEAEREVRRGGRGARAPRQVVAAGRSKSRRAGVVQVPELPTSGGTSKARSGAKARTRKSASNTTYSAGAPARRKSATRQRPRAARAVSRVVKEEPARTRTARARPASPRSAAGRSEATRKAARTKGAAARSAAARKAARTRSRNRGLSS
jgi:hypothetical protein